MSDPNPTAARSLGDPRKILRFRKSERLVHWAFAIPFLVCYATAAVLIFAFYSRPQAPQREVISWVHRLSGLAFFFLPPAVVLRKRGDINCHLNNVRQAWVWTIADIKWLALLGVAAVNKRVTLPDQGKFNAAEKLNFMLLMTTYPFYLVTGALIWFTHGAFLAWIAHIVMVAIATPLIFGHMYMAVINPETRVGLTGMITGYVDRRWAKHHYRHWYDEKVREHVAVAPAADTAALPVESAPPEPTTAEIAGAVRDAVALAAATGHDLHQPEPTPR